MKVPSDWFTTFFTGLAAESVGSLFPPEWTRAEAAFIVATPGLQPGARILDVPCGGGRLALELASLGHRVTGVDLASDLVGAAEAAARERGLEADFETGDMRGIPWAAKFDAVVCFGNSFPYFDDEGNEAFLRAAARALRPSGRLVLNVPTLAEAIFPHLVACSWHEVGDILMLRKASHDPGTGQIVTEYTFIRGDVVEKKAAVYRVYTYREMVRMLRDAGFAAVEGFGSMAGEPFQLGSRNCYIRATRA
jgi:2-polyprenyl-3-methyl-5-hydroxy-6-metoxy-1,4-benzoquinol methylase